jgi:hypothetical protein
MKKLLALLMLVLPVMAMENNEEYSDKTPNFKLIGSYNLISKLEKSKSIEEYRIFTYEKGMSNCVYSPFFISDNNKYLFIARQTSNIGTIDLKKCSVMVNEIVSHKNQWDCPRPFLNHKKEDFVNLLSWRYIHYHLHTYPQAQYKKKYRNDYSVEPIFNLIKKQSLENTFIRILIHRDSVASEKIYIAYESSEELNMIEKFNIFTKDNE